jgi:hypothetical protein
VGDRVNTVPVLYEAIGDSEPGFAGLGHPETPVAVPTHPSPWKYALVMSVVSAATGWALEGVARHFRKRKERG